VNLAALLCAIGSGLAASLVPALFKRQGPEPGRQMGLLLGGNLFCALAAAAAVPALGGSFGGGRFLLVGAAAGLLTAVNTWSYLGVVLHRGPVSISWAVVYLSAPVTALMGWALLGEHLGGWQTLGLASFLACLAVMALAARRTAARRGGELAPRKGYWTWLAAALLAGGACGFLMKFKDRAEPAGHLLGFLAISSAVCVAALAVVCAARGTRPAMDRRTWGLAAAYGALLLACQALLLQGLKGQTTVLFPVQAGAAVSFGLLWAFLGGERPSRLAYAGAALAVLAIALMNLGGGAVLGGR